jgi:hypothetical protein
MNAAASDCPMKLPGPTRKVGITSESEKLDSAEEWIASETDGFGEPTRG